jgi:hypothetical protein
MNDRHSFSITGSKTDATTLKSNPGEQTPSSRTMKAKKVWNLRETRRNSLESSCRDVSDKIKSMIWPQVLFTVPAHSIFCSNAIPQDVKILRTDKPEAQNTKGSKVEQGNLWMTVNWRMQRHLERSLNRKWWLCVYLPPELMLSNGVGRAKRQMTSRKQ